MANTAVWYYTGMPPEVTDSIVSSLETFTPNYQRSLTEGGSLDPEVRDSENVWVPTSLWIGGYLWFYIQQANQQTFNYDVTEIENGSFQLTRYGVGQHYKWHMDDSLTLHYSFSSPSSRGISQERAQQRQEADSELVRKLSFSLQLSDATDYKGGQLQLLDQGKSFFAPKQRGTLVIFDSRLSHRVKPVTEGVRTSLVGWVVGPRWK